jgi:hypothetical protein
MIDTCTPTKMAYDQYVLIVGLFTMMFLRDAVILIIYLFFYISDNKTKWEKKKT